MKHTQPECPECEKLSVIADESNKIGEFMNWMIDDTNYRVCGYEEMERYYPSSHLEREKLLAKYFNIDLDKVEQERRALLEWLRQEQE